MPAFPADYYAVVAQILFALFLLIGVELRWLMYVEEGEATFAEFEAAMNGTEDAIPELGEDDRWTAVRRDVSEVVSSQTYAGVTTAVGLVATAGIAEWAALATLHRQDASAHDDRLIVIALIAMSITVLLAALLRLGVQVVDRNTRAITSVLEEFAARYAATDEASTDEADDRVEALGRAIEGVISKRLRLLLVGMGAAGLTSACAMYSVPVYELLWRLGLA
jgi:hypothetical protein